ncbi:hypothetical protein D3C78_1417670 [compost metagenome]
MGVKGEPVVDAVVVTGHPRQHRARLSIKGVRGHIAGERRRYQVVVVRAGILVGPKPDEDLLLAGVTHPLQDQFPVDRNGLIAQDGPAIRGREVANDLEHLVVREGAVVFDETDGVWHQPIPNACLMVVPFCCRNTMKWSCPGLLQAMEAT